jgi:hypothetical protein
MDAENRQKWLDRGVWLLIAFCWLYLFTYSRSLNNPNERTRVMQTRAIVEHGRLSIGESFRDESGRLKVRDLYGTVHDGQFVNDLSLVCKNPRELPPDCEGLIYPAKAPGAQFLGVPAVFVAELLGAIPGGPAGEMPATWVTRYFGIALFMFLSLFAFARLLVLVGLNRSQSRAILLATALGTTIFTYGIMTVGHALAGGALVVGLWLLIEAQRKSCFLCAILSGLAAAAAVFLEYHSIIAVLCIAVWPLLMKDRRKVLPGFAVGAAVMAVLYIILHQVMFHSPFSTGHSHLMSAHNRVSQSSGYLGISTPHLGSLIDHLFDPYMGFLPLMPWLLFGGGLGIYLLFRKQHGDLPVGAARVTAAIFLVYLLFVVCLDKWRMMNGWSIGPRYLVPAVLPLSLAAAVGYKKLTEWNQWAAHALLGLMAASVIIIASLTAVFPQPPDALKSPFGELAVPLLFEGSGVRNFGLLLGLGSFSLLPFFLAIFGSAAWITLSSKRKLIYTAVTVAVAIIWLVSLALIRPTKPPDRAHWQEFSRQQVETRHLRSD